MKQASSAVLRIVIVLCALTVLHAATAGAVNLRQGAVYVMSNSPTDNSILAFSRANNGTLTPAGEFSTGGLGNGTVADALGSQGGLVMSGQFLFAVNAGSDEISSLRIGKNGLALAATVPSGGTMPVSVAVNEDLLYVLNAGSGDIAGFRIGPHGGLGRIAGSTQALGGGAAAGAAQIAFTADGSALVVTEKATNQIDVFPLNDDGVAGEAVVSPSRGETPFGFAINEDGQLFVSEAFGGADGASAASSYTIGADNTLDAVSESVRNRQTASCWIALSQNGEHAFVTNTGSGTISRYGVGEGGDLTLEAAVAATTGGGPIDMALARGGRYLYVVVDTTGEIAAFRVRPDGALAPLTGVSGLPPFFQGIVAR